MEEFSIKALTLHNELIEELDNQNYDYFTRQESEQQDQQYAIAQQTINQDKLLRQKIGGPTIRQEKYHAKYWKIWNKERQLLEDISKEAIQLEQTKKLYPQYFPPKEKLSRKTKGTKGDFRQHSTKSHYFAPPNTKPSSNVYFTHNDDEIENMQDSQEKIYKLLRQVATNTNDKDVKDTKDTKEFKTLDNQQHIKGGAFSFSQRLKPNNETLLTSNCDIPPLESLEQRNLLGGKFGSSSRFPKLLSNSNSNAIPFPDASNPKPSTVTPGVSFPQATRFPSQSSSASDGNQKQSGNAKELLNATPGPGNYQVDRLFDDIQGRNFDEIYTKLKDLPLGLRGLSTPELTPITYYGYKCNLQEHILYGRCQNPNCCQRSKVEEVMIRGNDLKRIGGYGLVAKKGKKITKKLEKDIQLTNEYIKLLPQAIYKMNALYTAAYNQDLAMIRKLGSESIAIDPNVRQEDTGYTALHIATIRNSIAVVETLLQTFQEKIDVNIADFEYETPLHIASKKGLNEIVTLICNHVHCNPLVCQNLDHKYPIDLAANHNIFREIRLTTEKNKLQQELQALMT